jgi:hypothetical protein
MGSAKSRLAIALVLIAVCWPLNWMLPGLRTHLLFFPLWLGYALLVDALVQIRSGTSLAARSFKKYAMLFAFSVPGWWLFEILNQRLRNWEYIGREHFSDLAYFLLASISFSTVIPAVFGTAELLRTSVWFEKTRGPRIPELPYFTLGAIAFTVMLIWPRLFYPFLWLSLWLMIDPLNKKLGRRSLLNDLHAGDWRAVSSLALGCLICGFWWELWNFYSYPKWIYHVPFFDYARVFEMPLAGYVGYLFFGPELYALYQLISPPPWRVQSKLDAP